jgi:hypothetical protein
VAIDGSATLTIVMSMPVTQTLRQHTASTRPRRTGREALVLLLMEDLVDNR